MKGGNLHSTSWEVVTGLARCHAAVYGVYGHLAVEGNFREIGSVVDAAAAIDSAVGVVGGGAVEEAKAALSFDRRAGGRYV